MLHFKISTSSNYHPMIIFKIARTELRNLFYSPVAWFVAVVFLIQCAFNFTTNLCNIGRSLDFTLQQTPDFKITAGGATSAFFTGKDSFIAIALQNLYLYIPLLTMGLLSREINNGTIKLLYSSPIKLRQIVLGKYLAIMIYGLLLVCIIGLFMATGAVLVNSIDYSLLFSIVIGVYLLICTYAAIGMFMSSLTNYQVISGVATFVVIFILGRIGSLWQKYDVLRDLTWFLHISGRTEKMLKGFITTKDVIYFLLIIFMFLAFTLFRLKSGRETKPWGIKAFRYIAVLVSVLVIGYVSSRPGLIGYWDTTATKANTVHPRTQEIIKELGDTTSLEITMYVNLFGEGLINGLPEGRNEFLDKFGEPYQRFKPNTRFKYVYYYDDDGSLNGNFLYKKYPGKTEQQIAGIEAKGNETDSSMFMAPEQVRKLTNPYPEGLRLFMTLKYGNRSINLRTFKDAKFWPDEEAVDDALKYLVQANAPKIYFLTGNLERDIYKKGEREYSDFSIEKSNRNALINHAFDLDTLSLEKQKLPADMDLLVIADPKVILGAATMSKIQQYVDKGGNMLIMGEPGKQYVLNPLLKNLGVQLRPGTLVQLSKYETPDKVIPRITPSGANLAEEGILLWLKDGLIRKDTNVVLTVPMPGAAALSYAANSSYTVIPLLNTVPQQTWLKMGTLVLDSVPPVFTPLEGDQRDPTFPTAVQLTRQIDNKQQRIIVCGDADFTSNLRLSGNVFRNSFYNWFSNGKYPQYLPQAYVSKDIFQMITYRSAEMLKIMYVWVLPGLLLLTCAVILIRRRRK
jgi:ABC-2 type transport system permease protein